MRKLLLAVAAAMLALPTAALAHMDNATGCPMWDTGLGSMMGSGMMGWSGLWLLQELLVIILLVGLILLVFRHLTGEKKRR